MDKKKVLAPPTSIVPAALQGRQRMPWEVPVESELLTEMILSCYKSLLCSLRSTINIL